MTRYTDEHRDPRIHARELPPPSPGEHDLARARPEAVDALLRGAWLPPVEATRASVAAALLEGAAALVPHDSAVVVERAAPHGWTPLARRPDAAESDASAEDLYEAVGRHARTLLVTPEGDDPVRDDGPAREVAVPIFDGLAVRFVARFHRGSAEGFDLTEARLLALLCAQARPWFKTSVAFEAVRRQSRSDPLTGLGNRRDLDEALHRLASAHRRGGRMLSLLMVDLDGFKEFNDRWGHGRGDEVLRRFARLLRATLRDGDVACRYGGDEFAIVLPDTDETGARHLGERIRAAVSRARFGPLGERLSVSIGAAALGDDATDERALLERADGALFAVKQGGRDGVALADTGGADPRDPSRRGDRPTGADNVAHHIVRAALEAVGARRGSLVWRRGDRFYLHTVVGFSPKPIPEGVEIEPHVGVLGELFREGKPMVVEDLRGLGIAEETGRGYTHGSFLAIPLYWSGRPVGALCLANKTEEQPFSTDDLALILPLVKTLMDCLGGRVRGDEERTLH